MEFFDTHQFENSSVPWRSSPAYGAYMFFTDTLTGSLRVTILSVRALRPAYGAYMKLFRTPPFPNSSVPRRSSPAYGAYMFFSHRIYMELQAHYIESKILYSLGTLESRRHDPKIITETIAPQSIIFGFYTFQHCHQLEKPAKNRLKNTQRSQKPKIID